MSFVELKKKLVLLDYLLKKQGRDKDSIMLVQREVIIDFFKNRASALLFSAELGSIDFVRYFFDKNDTLTANLALISAAERGHLQVVKFLIINGADAHQKDKRILQRALKNGHFEVAEYLMNHKSKLNGILKEIVKDDDLDALIFLWNIGERVFSEYVLREAIIYGSLRIANFLDDYNSQVVPDDELFFRIIEDGNSNSLRYLKDREYDLSMIRRFLLGEAIRKKNLDIAKFLLTLEPNNEKDLTNWMRLAIEVDDESAIEILLKNGANILTLSREDLFYSLRKNNYNVAFYLAKKFTEAEMLSKDDFIGILIELIRTRNNKKSIHVPYKEKNTVRDFVIFLLEKIDVEKYIQRLMYELSIHPDDEITFHIQDFLFRKSK